MSNFVNPDGSALVGGLLPSGVGEALQFDASGNLKTTSAGAGAGTQADNITQINSVPISTTAASAGTNTPLSDLLPVALLAINPSSPTTGNYLYAAGADGVITAYVLEAVAGMINAAGNADRWRGANGVGETTSGGRQTTAIAAAGSANIKATPGRLAKVLVTTAGTAVLTFYDNAAGGSTGTIIGVVAANAAVGTLLDVQMPAAAGISAVGGAGSPAVTVSWT